MVLPDVSIYSRDTCSPTLSTFVQTVEDTKCFSGSLSGKHVTAIIAYWKVSLVALCSQGATQSNLVKSRHINEWKRIASCFFFDF